MRLDDVDIKPNVWHSAVLTKSGALVSILDWSKRCEASITLHKAEPSLEIFEVLGKQFYPDESASGRAGSATFDGVLDVT